MVLGCRAVIEDKVTGKSLTAIVGDFGPATHLGEASIAVANFFGINSSPKRGGTSARRFKYRIFPGQNVDGYRLIPLK